MVPETRGHFAYWMDTRSTGLSGPVFPSTRRKKSFQTFLDIFFYLFIVYKYESFRRYLF